VSSLIVVAVMDRAALAYARPAFLATTGIALRQFIDEVNRDAADNPLNRHPDDFELWMIATWDEQSGEFANERKLLMKARDALRQDT